MGTRRIFALKHAKRVATPLWKPLRPRQSLLLARVHKRSLRGKESSFGRRLRLRRFVCLVYGNLSAHYFARTAAHVARAQTSFGQTLLATLERRLDVAIFRAGFAHSILHARQQIKHGHLSVNGQRARVPSTLLRNGDLFAWNSLDITPSFLARPGHPKASHLEVSHACHSAIFLFTPQNIFLPSFVDPKDLATLASA